VRSRARASFSCFSKTSAPVARSFICVCARTRCLSFVCVAVLSHIPVCMQAHIHIIHTYICIYSLGSRGAKSRFLAFWGSMVCSACDAMAKFSFQTYVSVCVCVFVCVHREREGGRDRARVRVRVAWYAC
jgi:hypothetical protein